MRCGVFLCECGGNISDVLDLEALAAEVVHLETVAEVRIEQFLCGTEGHRQISEAVELRGLDHLVIGSCSPRFQGPTFERIARELGLGENAVAFANLREGCSFVHRNQPAAAQAKAARILRAAIARAAHQHDLPRKRVFLHRSALVVGGGIAGMTAAEELTASGIEVHLVEREATIGGFMARLAKTFPTEDCAMCSLAPRLTDTALDPRIHLHTLTDVTEISGPPGEFRVRLVHHPRYVSPACVGCGECTAVCPVSYPSDFECGMARRTAISRPFSNAVPATFHVERKGWSPCKAACPVHTSVQGCIALIAAGRFDEAYRVASKANPFPGVCSRICPRPCEVACARSKVDEPLALADLSRFVTDTVRPDGDVPRPAAQWAEKVAVVGAGPSGLTCAHDLAQLGYDTTVFESRPVAGGMLRAGIPDYRLPKDVLQYEIDAIAALGVDIRLGQRCAVDFTVDSLFADGFSAVYLATGLQSAVSLDVPGTRLRGVLCGLTLLRTVNAIPESERGAGLSGSESLVGRQVIVYGCGDDALDAARTAIRLQQAEGVEPDVTLAHSGARLKTSASPREVARAREEGVRIEPLVEPLEILGSGGSVTGMRLHRSEPGTADGGDRPRRGPVSAEPFELPADTVVIAAGRALDDDFLTGCPGVVRDGEAVRVDRATLMTDRPAVFAGGDVAPARHTTAIEAIAAGGRAARSIHDYLRGAPLLPVWQPKATTGRPDGTRLASSTRSARVPVPRCDGTQRRGDWREVDQPYSAEQAMTEARRCLDCAVCADCGACTLVCPANAIDFSQSETTEELTVGAVILATGHKEFDARRKVALGYGRYPNVLTQSQLARLTSAAGPTEGQVLRPSDGQPPRNVFMLQCVGSRDCSSTGNEHCSAICCLFATLHASLIKQYDQSIEVTIGYTDLRAPGKAHEEYYRLVQSRGVRYVRSRVGEILQEPDKSLRVRFEDTVTGRKFDERYDMVVLSAGIEASEGTRDIAHVVGAQTGAAGFIREYHPKLRPVDTQRAGVFVCGTAQGPKSIPDSIAQAKAAAARVVSMLSTGFVLTPGQVAIPDPAICIGCGVCETVCPQGAITLTTGSDAHSVVDPTICRGCGICSADCPTGAMQLGGFTDRELLAEAAG